MFKQFLLCLLVTGGVLPSPVVYANTNQATILLFHRFGENKYPSTNIRTEQLEYLIRYIQQNNYTVLPLKTVVHAIQNNKTLPPKTLALTIDDAYKSTFIVAYPRFKSANMPFTVFVSTKEVNNKNKNYMTWQDIKTLSKNGVGIEPHTVSHAYMLNDNKTKNISEIQQSIADIKKHTGIKPTLFAYPYGETSTAIIQYVKDNNIRAGFGQQSGVYNNTSNQFYIPRFPMSEKYSTTKHIKTILNAKAFPIQNFTPKNPHITTNNPPKIQFDIPKNLTIQKTIQCYQSKQGKIKVTIKKYTATLHIYNPLPHGRTRINCTLPSKKGGYHWLGIQKTVR